MKPKVAVIGDFVTDVLFPIEAKTLLTEAKETIFTSSLPNEEMPRAMGGTKYIQEIMKLLFKSHLPIANNKNDSEDIFNARIAFAQRLENNLFFQEKPEDADFQSAEMNYWTVAKKRKRLSELHGETYRIIERLGRFSKRDATFKPEYLPSADNFSDGIPDLIVIGDHNRHIRGWTGWKDSDYKRWLTATNKDPLAPKRIILLANKLPMQVLHHQPSGVDPAGEAMWDTMYKCTSEDCLKSTVVVTSIDRLRQEGANISKRLSWDDTLATFLKELKNFPPLEELGKVGHLIVRIGLVGAIHCYWKILGEGKQEREIRFLYDPNATQGIFRDRPLQGNAFAIRSIMPACIAFQTYLEMVDDPDQMLISARPSDSKRDYVSAIRRGIKDAIHLSQEIYTAGFGTSLENVREFMIEPKVREHTFRISADKAYKHIDEQVDVVKNKERIKQRKSIRADKFIHIVRPPTDLEQLESDVPTQSWSILRDNLRAMIKEKELLTELERDIRKHKSSKPCIDASDKLSNLEELRRLRMARAIVFVGVDEAINNVGATKEVLRGSSELVNTYLTRMLEVEQEADKRFCKRLQGEIGRQEIREIVNIEWYKNAFPLNVPVATFGALRVLGQTDTENFSSIRNLLTKHLSRTESKPLSIAVFGSPGSGKSFGIKAIAKAIAGDSIEFYTCNLSQLSSREDLNREFFSIFQILLQGKTPLIFFDEFDCSLFPGGRKNEWLKYFLEPMQDGFYRHTDGIGELRNSIFVFAGGTVNKFKQFYDPSLKDDSEAKAAKVPDFVSRLHGIIDMPGLNPGEDDAHVGVPYIRRALALRVAIEADKRLLDDDLIARLDRNIVDAFLRVSKYRHGSRSIAAVLGMCMRWNNSVEKSSLPTKQQLEVHTDGKEFWDYVENPRPYDKSAHGDQSSLAGSTNDFLFLSENYQEFSSEI